MKKWSYCGPGEELYSSSSGRVWALTDSEAEAQQVAKALGVLTPAHGKVLKYLCDNAEGIYLDEAQIKLVREALEAFQIITGDA